MAQTVALTTKVGSLLDILPKPRTPEWDALPPFVRKEVEQLRRGWRPLSKSELSDHAMLPRRVDYLATEIVNLREQTADIHKGQSELGATLIPLVEAVLEQVHEIGKRLTAVEADRDKHAVRLDVHAAKLATHDARHVEHIDQITGVFKRLVILETTVIKKPIKRRKRR